MNYSILIKEIKILCSDTGQFIREHYGKLNADQIQTKEKNSLVSFVDQQSELRITSRLKELLPEAAFMTEENMIDNSDAELQWIVDPLDGTTNYLVGIPQCAISIGLTYKGKVVLGVVYDIFHHDLYHAELGKGAFLNDQKIHVADAKPLNECAIATGFPYDKNLILEGHIKTMSYFLRHARIVRRLGAAALDLCLVAKGTFDLFYEKHLNAWDLAAGSLIVLEAGGKVHDIDGTHSFLQNGSIVAYAPSQEEAAEFISFHF